MKSSTPPIRVSFQEGITDFSFTEAFQIGRDKTCAVPMNDPGVSRFHAEVVFDEGRWIIRDLTSSNGTFLDGVQIQDAPLPARGKVEVGKGGPVIWLTVEATEKSHTGDRESNRMDEEKPSLTQVMDRYFIQSELENAGEHTIMIRQAFKRARTQQARKYKFAIGLVACFLAGAISFSIYQHNKIQNLKKMAEAIFYNMKSLEIQMAQITAVVESTASISQRQAMASKQLQLAAMQKDYDHFLEKIGFYNEALSEEDRIILRMARIFGECEINAPKGFVDEVRRYIKNLRSTDKLKNAVNRAMDSGYSEKIVDELLANHLPPQFFYLALQESGFKEKSVGPRTRFGYAKGIWQFIPSTAVEYGLKTGPLVELPLYDPRDERFHVEKATHAAVKYLRDIYSTEAQASGLLVMASYNWGDNRVKKLIRRMPENPKERNFWKLLQNQKVPKETYDYVFNILAAGVIGENPQLFGFDFNNPLPS